MSVEYYISIRDKLETGESFTPDETRFLGSLIFLVDQGVRVDPHLNKFREEALYHERNQHLQNAYELLLMDEPDTALERLIVKIKRFDTGRWPIWQKNGLPDDADEIMSALYEAFKVQHRISENKSIPTSQKRLKDILDIWKPIA